MKRWIFVLMTAGMCLTACGQDSSLIYEYPLDNAAQESEIRTDAEVSVKKTSDQDAGTEDTVANPSDQDAADSPSNRNEVPEASVYYVYVCGAVQNPGVYSLAAGSRIYEAIAAAGGTTADADDRFLNQAALLTDGQQIIVYTREETEAFGEIASGRSGADSAVNDSDGNELDQTASGRINLNTADKQTLMTLSGIGEARAEAILRYREENGSFQSIEEIKNIEGIKEKAFEKIKDDIEV